MQCFHSFWSASWITNGIFLFIFFNFANFTTKKAAVCRIDLKVLWDFSWKHNVRHQHGRSFIRDRLLEVENLLDLFRSDPGIFAKHLTGYSGGASGWQTGKSIKILRWFWCTLSQTMSFMWLLTVPSNYSILQPYNQQINDKTATVVR